MKLCELLAEAFNKPVEALTQEDLSKALQMYLEIDQQETGLESAQVLDVRGDTIILY